MVDFVFNTEVDMIECAMWWELPEPGVGLHKETHTIHRGTGAGEAVCLTLRPFV